MSYNLKYYIDITIYFIKLIGRWEGTAKFKAWFNNGGAIEFGQCLLNAGRLGLSFFKQILYLQVALSSPGILLINL